MKTLKKNNEFKRVKDTSNSDNERIKELLNAGWNYCPKTEWKEATRTKKEEPKTDKKEVKKRGKNS